MVEDPENLECLRCGYHWYSDKYDDHGELPGECPRCYRDKIRAIPPPPTLLEKEERIVKQKLRNLPPIIRSKSYHTKIWIESHRSTIGLLATALVMLIGVSVLSYAVLFI
jgi:hypothetical protein